MLSPEMPYLLREQWRRGGRAQEKKIHMANLTWQEAEAVLWMCMGRTTVQQCLPVLLS